MCNPPRGRSSKLRHRAGPFLSCEIEVLIFIIHLKLNETFLAATNFSRVADPVGILPVPHPESILVLTGHATIV